MKAASETVWIVWWRMSATALKTAVSSFLTDFRPSSKKKKKNGGDSQFVCFFFNKFYFALHFHCVITVLPKMQSVRSKAFLSPIITCPAERYYYEYALQLRCFSRSARESAVQSRIKHDVFERKSPQTTFAYVYTYATAVTDLCEKLVGVLLSKISRVLIPPKRVRQQHF